MATGDRTGAHISALIVPSETFLAELGLAAADMERAEARAAAEEALGKAVARANQRLRAYERVRRWRAARCTFTPETACSPRPSSCAAPGLHRPARRSWRNWRERTQARGRARRRRRARAARARGARGARGARRAEREGEGAMIRYALRCGNGHGFEGWFRDSRGFEQEQRAGRLACPVCRGARALSGRSWPPNVRGSRGAGGGRRGAASEERRASEKRCGGPKPCRRRERQQGQGPQRPQSPPARRRS